MNLINKVGVRGVLVLLTFLVVLVLVASSIKITSGQVEVELPFGGKLPFNLSKYVPPDKLSPDTTFGSFDKAVEVYDERCFSKKAVVTCDDFGFGTDYVKDGGVYCSINSTDTIFILLNETDFVGCSK